MKHYPQYGHGTGDMIESSWETGNLIFKVRMEEETLEWIISKLPPDDGYTKFLSSTLREAKRGYR